MNILIPAGIFPPDIGGPANFVPRIAQWLAQRGHEVQVVCWSDSLEHDDSHYAFKIHRIARSGSRLQRLIQTVRSLYRLGKSSDVVFANGLDLEARIAATLLRKPELHKVVGDRAWEIARVRRWYENTIDAYQIANKSVRLRLLDLFRNISLARAELIITPSHYLKKIVCGWGVDQRRLQVIYNATALNQVAEASPVPPFAGKTIVTVCRLVPWKGVDKLINVLQHLPETRLVIAGDGPDRNTLEQLALSLCVADRVTFLGQIPNQQVRALFEAADLFVLNSSYEGLPHVVLEAMAARVPVIATDVGGTHEVVKHNETGLLIPFGDDRALLEATQKLLHSAETCQRLTDNARKLMEESFDEERCFLAYEKALTQLAALNSTLAVAPHQVPQK